MYKILISTNKSQNHPNRSSYRQAYKFISINFEFSTDKISKLKNQRNIKIKHKKIKTKTEKEIDSKPRKDESANLLRKFFVLCLSNFFGYLIVSRVFYTLQYSRSFTLYTLFQKSSFISPVTICFYGPTNFSFWQGKTIELPTHSSYSMEAHHPSLQYTSGFYHRVPWKFMFYYNKCIS